MTAKDKAEQAASAKEQRRRAAEQEGMRQCLSSADGRALISWLTKTALSAEGQGSRQLRAFGRDILLAATVADWEGVQTMREEWERPALGARAETAEQEEEE